MPRAICRHGKRESSFQSTIIPTGRRIEQQGWQSRLIGSSAGGVEALSLLLKVFPPNLPAAVFIVQHMGRWFAFSEAFVVNPTFDTRTLFSGRLADLLGFLRADRQKSSLQIS